MSTKVAVLSGSLRKESYNTKLAKAFVANAPDGIEAELIDIHDLPVFNEDLEAPLPEPVARMQTAVKAAGAVILITPEHNRSFSAAIKNALDWGSRPYGTNVWDGKPTGFAGCTPYNLGTIAAQSQLRQVATYLNMQPLQKPEFYLEQAAEKFDTQGNVADQKTREKIDEFWRALAQLIERMK